MTRSASETRIGGFTLLEVMIALAILAGSLILLIEVQGNSIRQSEYARGLTIATLLARGKMVEIEAELREEGFGTFEEFLEGDFADQGYNNFRWEAEIKKVEMAVPSDLPDLDQVRRGGGEGGGGPAGEELSAISAGQVAGMLSFISNFLKDTLRECKLTVYWPEGKRERSFSVTTHLLDLERSGLRVPP